jgi:hypothetical protein
MDLSQEKLEELVVGKPIDPTIEFYEQALLDVDASKAEKRRVYKTQLMVKRRVPGVTDYVAQRATAVDVRRWPAEYHLFKTQVESKKSPGVEVIPGISSVEKQELIDRGYSTVERLATAPDLPEYLAHLQPPARRIHMAIKAEESHNGNEEENQQEDRREAQQAESVPAEHRQHHGPHVGQREVPRVPGDPREAREGVHQGRRDDSGKDWEVTFQL